MGGSQTRMFPEETLLALKALRVPCEGFGSLESTFVVIRYFYLQ